jgi:hypothetical protein
VRGASDLPESAIHVDLDSSEVPGIVGCKKRHGCNFLGCPNRFSGTFAAICFANSLTASFANPILPKIGVTIGPGATVFTRMAARRVPRSPFARTIATLLWLLNPP